jgi:hypothetical protein
MQIQLKQSEIIAALKQYINSQGISLAGKEVSISFTAGRKEAGITADISIDDVAIPGFTDATDDAEAAKPVLTVVTAPAVAEPESKPAADMAPAEETAKATTSLFN